MLLNLKNLLREFLLAHFAEFLKLHVNSAMASDGRVGYFSHYVSKDQLLPGDHIYAWRYNIYAHHGIYTGKKGQVIHSSADPGVSRSQSKSSAIIRTTTVEEFCNGSKLRLASYGVSRLTRVSKCYGSCYCTSSVKSDEVINTAKSCLEDPDKWGKYNVSEHNCEHFVKLEKIISKDKLKCCNFIAVIPIIPILMTGKNLLVYTIASIFLLCFWTV